jgi:CRP-like cAMP-binding protein
VAKLVDAEAERLKPHAEAVALEQGEILFQADQEITHIYFPHDGVISLQVLGADGTVVEAATIGATP